MSNPPVVTRRSQVAATLLAILVFTLLGVLSMPGRRAEARDYRMGPVDIEAQITAQGLLVVQEDRTFEFDGDFNGVYWELATGTVEGQPVEISVQGVGIVGQDGAWTPFELADSGAPRTYTLASSDSEERVTLYNPASDQTLTYRVVYTVENGIVAWSDVAELYWKFVSNDWDEPSYDVTCTVHLPVPQGRTVTPGRDVRAWGHGTLDGEVTISRDGTITYTVPEVGTDDFAEARITFPVGWLTVLPRNESHLPAILAEEEQWAAEANAQRERARAFTYGTATAVVGVGIAAILAAIWGAVSYRRRHRADFQDPYWREAPSRDHPAVIGALVDGGDPGEKEFTATLMGLTDQHVIGLDLVRTTKKGLFGDKPKEDYRLTLHRDRVRTIEDPIDVGAVGFLFEDVAPKTPTYRRVREAAEERAGEAGGGADGDAVLAISEMGDVAKRYPGRYADGLDEWKSTVKAAVEARGFYEDSGFGGRVALVAVCVISGIATVGGFILMAIIEPPWWYLSFLLVPLAGAIACGVVAGTSRGYSDEADEVKAKALALRRWLKDFTRLDEAIPTDVVLWNQLLVYAVVLGVADEVISQLRVAMPQIIDDPYFYPGYVWYMGHGHLGSPMRVMGDAFNSSYRASQAAIAASSNSSGSGGGGGFSGGGGGGFGGGGGGGAF